MGPVAYDCTQADSPAGAVLATFFQTQPALVIVEREGGTRPGFAVPAASGAKFLGTDLVFRDTSGQASAVWSGVTLECRRQ